MDIKEGRISIRNMNGTLFRAFQKEYQLRFSYATNGFLYRMVLLDV